MTNEEYEEIRRDVLLEQKREEIEAYKLCNDEEYCLEFHGLDEVADSIRELLRQVNNYGHEMTIKDLFENWL